MNEDGEQLWFDDDARSMVHLGLSLVRTAAAGILRGISQGRVFIEHAEFVRNDRVIARDARVEFDMSPARLLVYGLRVVWAGLWGKQMLGPDGWRIV